MRRKTVFTALLCFSFVISMAQTTREEIYLNPEKSGGVYYTYPDFIDEAYTPAPTGYAPFYINHYGRHGSRYMGWDKEYMEVVSVLRAANDAGMLTELGKELYRRIELVWEDAEGISGQLTNLGAQQHRDIAARASLNYPQVFTDGRLVNACSTTYTRCALSMAAFCTRLAQLNPTLDINMKSGDRYNKILHYWSDELDEFIKTEWPEINNNFKKAMLNPERLMKSLFLNADYVNENINALKFMTRLFEIASDMQNVDIDVSLYDVFEKEELFNLWQTNNLSFYTCSASAWGKEGVISSAKPLLLDIIKTGNEAIKNRRIAANLRFGHDINLIPLCSVLGLEGSVVPVDSPEDIYKVWSDFKRSPMAANLQMIFYSNADHDVLVKFLLNEKETFIPALKSVDGTYYHWTDLEAYYRNFWNLDE